VYYIPQLVEALRTSNHVVRLSVHKTLLELQKADYSKSVLPKELVAWAPQKNETAADTERFVRLWLEWWRTTETSPQQ
jgi:hypothetical protein